MKRKKIWVFLMAALLCAALLAGCEENVAQNGTTLADETTSQTQMETTTWESVAASTSESEMVTEETTLALEDVDSAEDILQLLGYTIPELPEGASDASYSAFEEGELTIAEVTFSYKNANWSFRISNLTGEDTSESIRDISGSSEQHLTSAEALISWCNAMVSYDPGAAGKIIWNDYVPGLAYSLTTDTGANEWDLVAVAETLFAPAQNDVG